MNNTKLKQPKTLREIDRFEKALRDIDAVIFSDPRQKDWIAGGKTGIKKGVVLSPNGKWHDVLVLAERQLKKYVDTLACVTFSCLTIFEMLFKKLWNLIVNFSDRFTAKMSNTTKKGNSSSNVAESARTDGVVDEKDWPYPDTIKTWEEFYKIIPQWIKDKAKKWLDKITPNHESVWFTKSGFKSGLLKSPLQVGVIGWYRNKTTNIYYSPVGIKHQHMAVLIGYYTKQEILSLHDLFKSYGMIMPILKDGIEYPVIFDSYNPFIKVLDPDYRFHPWAKGYTIRKKENIMQLKNGHLYQLVEGGGGWGIAVDDKLLIGTIGNVVGTFIMRNKGYITDKVVAVNQADWDSVPHYNLKRQLIEYGEESTKINNDTPETPDSKSWWKKFLSGDKQFSGSEKKQLNKVDWQKIGLGGLMAMAGALMTYITEALTSIDFGDFTPVIVAIWGIIVNAVRKYFTNYQTE